MANVQNGNSAYVDSTGQLTEGRTLLSAIVFTPAAADDQLILKDDDTNGSLKIAIQAATAKQTVIIDLSNTPLLFPNGVYVSTITSGAIATLISGGS